jgi:hypothetical protein
VWVIDDALLDDVERCVVQAPATGPRFDIEVIAGPHVDFPFPVGDDPAAQMRDGALARARALRRALAGEGSVCGLLVALGDPSLAAVNGDEEAAAALDAGEIWADVLGRLGEAEASAVMCVPETPDRFEGYAAAFARNADRAAPSLPLAATFAVRLGEADEPYAYVAVIGLHARAEVDRAQALVRGLATGIAENSPLYVVGIDAGAELRRTLASAAWQRVRTSVALYGPAGHETVVTVGRTPLDARQARPDVALVPCPSFKPGTGQPGMARLRVDVVKGQAEIALLHERGSDAPMRPVQIVRPLVSASRVTSGERRLYARVREVLETALPKAGADDERAQLEELLALVEQRWEADGYATLCTEDRQFGGIPATRTARYLLLLVLRETPDGGYEILLSNHSPIRTSAVGDWNTLLLPAFQAPHKLLGHLRDDVVRQAFERAEDLDRGAHAQNFEESVDRILGRGQSEEDVWTDVVREIGTFTTRKVSPTTGFVTDYEYHFVTFLPFVERAVAKGGDGQTNGGGPDEDALDAHKMIEWLLDLDTVRSSGPLSDAPRGIALQALQHGGGGLRFEPQVELDDPPGISARARSQKAPPGAVWFPLGSGEDAPWRGSPSILARNADVMSRLDQILKPHLDNGGIPNELLLGRFVPRQRGYDTRMTYQFDAEPEEVDPAVPGLSTRDALRKVRFAKDSDLHDPDEHPYDGALFRRVYLVRTEVGDFPRERDPILVFDADVFEAAERSTLTEDDSLGRLRPVQRYVLKAGLTRAQDIDRQVVEPLRAAGNAFGFARVRKDGLGIEVSVTPPIIERLHPSDRGERGDREFIVCDGNHRVVQRAWIEGLPLEAVAVDGSLQQPYYALPFGDREWSLTADTCLASTPPQEAKYLVRKVTRADVERGGGDWSRVEKIPERNRYRRYFRDLEAGFGPMGGQGGRFA